MRNEPILAQSHSRVAFRKPFSIILISRIQSTGAVVISEEPVYISHMSKHSLLLWKGEFIQFDNIVKLNENIYSFGVAKSRT